jgi:predicted nucleotidyltransferase
MATTSLHLFRSVRVEQFSGGTVIEQKPAPEILYPDFAPRLLPSGKTRAADVTVTVSEEKEWVNSGGGTSLFDQANVFKSKGWLSFTLPEGTLDNLARNAVVRSIELAIAAK